MKSQTRSHARRVSERDIEQEIDILLIGVDRAAAIFLVKDREKAGKIGTVLAAAPPHE